jgi:hypothetical protein
MAGIDAPQARRAVENLAAICRRIMHVLGGDEHAGGFLELAVGRERHPEGAQIIRHHGVGIGH